MKNLKQYYKELGRLVYAVAAADGMVQEEEREKLHAFVVKELATHEKSFDTSGMNKAFYVDFEFDLSELHKPEIHEIVQTFNEFVRLNRQDADHDLLQRSLLLLESVASAYTRQKEKDIIEVVKEQLHPLILIPNHE